MEKTTHGRSLKETGRVVLAALIALILALTLVGCQSDESSTNEGSTEDAEAVVEAADSSDDDSRTLADSLGEVTISGDIENIVSTAPAYTIAFLLAGAVDNIVGIDSSTAVNEWILEKFPSLQDATQVVSSGEINLETLLSLEPDVVALAPSYADGYLTTLVEWGIACVSTPETLDDERLRDQVKLRQLYYGEVLGGEAQERSEAYAEYFDEIVELVESRVADIAEEDKKTVIEVYSVDPVTVINGNSRSMAQEYITTAGGINCAGDNTDDGTSGRMETSIEQIIAWDPDYIICYSEEVYEAIMSDSTWQSLTAVQEGHVYIMPQGLMLWGYNGPELTLMLEYMGKLLYPELFEDIDLKEEMDYFYETFFGIELTDEDYQTILKTDLTIEEYCEAVFG